jgi:dihydrofolate reductase
MAEKKGRTGAASIAIVFIVARAENGVIGRDNALPWHLKSDMQHFRALTMGKPVLMGRKTYASIGKPLRGRTNIVISRDQQFSASGIVVTPDIERALSVGRGEALRQGSGSIAVIGGAEIFAQTMPLATRLEVTEVHARPDGDTSIPEFDPTVWREISRHRHSPGPSDTVAYSFVTYERAG